MSTLTADPGHFVGIGGEAERCAAAPCAHCGLPVARGLLREGAERQFCCHACDTAFHAILGCGLERYYEYRESGNAEGTAAPARTTDQTFEAFDDPSFVEHFCTKRADGVHSVTLVLEGIHCAACVWLLERLPTVVPGVIDARVDFGRSQITIVHDPVAAPLSAIARFMARLGYVSHALRDRAARNVRLGEDRAALIRIGVAGALFGNAMVIAFALYGADASGMDPGIRAFLHVVSGMLAAASVLGPGRVFLRGAMASLRMRTMHMDVPIALALLVGLAHGAYGVARGSAGVYFDTLCTLVFLLLIGRWIQVRHQRRAADSIELLFSLSPSSAALVEGDSQWSVPVEALKAGDVVEVRAGESVPVDGVVRAGFSSVNAALLTGESKPVEIGPGDAVSSGFVNLTSPIRIETTATGRATRIGQLMALVEEESRRRAPIVRLADRIASRFVVIVLLLSAATFVAWLTTGIEQAVEHTVALLIITCPCALGLATPLAIVASLGRAARQGVLIKGGDALEALAGTGTLVLDKTGTLTTGEWRVHEYRGPDRLRPLIAAAERQCSHPAARALARAFDSDSAERPDAVIRNSVGGGIIAECEGSMLTIGSVRFVESRHPGMVVASSLRTAIDSALERGLSVVLIAENGAAVGMASLGDAVRDEAAGCLESLRQRGWRTVLLSGDDARIARSIGLRLGFSEGEIHGDASPESKAEFVRLLALQGTTVMVGDGVNDAAALTAATVGVSVQGGAEAAMATSDVFLSRSGLAGLVLLIDRARSAHRAIRRNLVASLLYNVLFGGLAMAGLVSPLVAAVLMPISSATVVLLSLHPGGSDARRNGGGA